MSAANHKLYKGNSEYYDAILARFGRGLGADTVTRILSDHGVSVEDYLGDPMIALGALPVETDASDLLAFLGY